MSCCSRKHSVDAAERGKDMLGKEEVFLDLSREQSFISYLHYNLSLCSNYLDVFVFLGPLYFFRKYDVVVASNRFVEYLMSYLNTMFCQC